MQKRYTPAGNRDLRRGFTTGLCAAAAAKAAARMAVNGQVLTSISLTTPTGLEVELPLSSAEVGTGTARCCVVKDAGDDPDVTDGLAVCARILLGPPGIRLRGGCGVGTVTRPGLPVPVGEPAINPVPRAHICQEVAAVLPPDTGAEVVIEVPGGEAVARRTLNPYLGIAGGISILGTTGIVEPWSEEAFKRSLVPQVSQAVHLGHLRLVLTPGRKGQKVVTGRGVPATAVVITGNFWGFMLEACVAEGVREILLCGHQGKMVKLAAGIFHTHNRVADGRAETLAAHAAAAGASTGLVRSILDCGMSEMALRLLDQAGLAGIFNTLAARASERARRYVDHRLRVGTVILGQDGSVIGHDAEGQAIGGALGWHIPST